MARKPKAVNRKAPSLAIEGAFFVWHSLAHVNRELAASLSSAGVDVRIVDDAPAQNVDEFPHGEQLAKLSRETSDAKVTLRHAFPPDFSPCSTPLVIMQPWEFLAAPASWVEYFSNNVSELWVNSNFTRTAFVNSGLPAERVFVLPLGYDESVFCIKKDLPPAKRSKGREFKFLYLGGTIERTHSSGPRCRFS